MQADFRLVTSNAKAFNLPGSIYHAEADRVEAWGLEHISKAAATVIQYEADWNIDIEKDDDANDMNDEDDQEYSAGVPMDVDEPGPGGRSSSVSSQLQPGTSRRPIRAPYRKVPPSTVPTISESIDSEGRLPGSKDGLGTFPPGSDWAQMMLRLKLKGIRPYGLIPSSGF